MSKNDFINGKDSAQNESGGEENNGQKNYVFFWIAIGCFAAGALLFALAFLI